MNTLPIQHLKASRLYGRNAEFTAIVERLAAANQGNGTPQPQPQPVQPTPQATAPSQPTPQASPQPQITDPQGLNDFSAVYDVVIGKNFVRQFPVPLRGHAQAIQNGFLQQGQYARASSTNADPMSAINTALEITEPNLLLFVYANINKATPDVLALLSHLEPILKIYRNDKSLGAVVAQNKIDTQVVANALQGVAQAVQVQVTKKPNKAPTNQTGQQPQQSPAPGQQTGGTAHPQTQNPSPTQGSVAVPKFQQVVDKELKEVAKIGNQALTTATRNKINALRIRMQNDLEKVGNGLNPSTLQTIAQQFAGFAVALLASLEGRKLRLQQDLMERLDKRTRSFLGQLSVSFSQTPIGDRWGLQFPSIAKEIQEWETAGQMSFGRMSPQSAKQIYDKLRPKLVEAIQAAGQAIGPEAATFASNLANNLDNPQRINHLFALLAGRKHERIKGTLRWNNDPMLAANTGSAFRALWMFRRICQTPNLQPDQVVQYLYDQIRSAAYFAQHAKLPRDISTRPGAAPKSNPQQTQQPQQMQQPQQGTVTPQQNWQEKWLHPDVIGLAVSVLHLLNKNMSQTGEYW